MNTYKRLPVLVLALILTVGFCGNLYSGSINDLAQDDTNILSAQEIDNQDQPDPKKKKSDPPPRKPRSEPRAKTPQVKKSPANTKAPSQKSPSRVKDVPQKAPAENKSSSATVKSKPQPVSRDRKDYSPPAKNDSPRVRPESKSSSPPVKETRQAVGQESNGNRTWVSPRATPESGDATPRVQRSTPVSRNDYNRVGESVRKPPNRGRGKPHRNAPRLLHLPDGYNSFHYNGHEYFHHRGVYYRHGLDGYYVSHAPIGYYVTYLPYGCYNFWYHDMWYYHYYGAYYWYDDVLEVYIIIENPVPEDEPDKPDIPGSSIFDVVQIFDGSTVEGYFVGGTNSTVLFQAIGDTLEIPISNIISITFAQPVLSDAEAE
ncbi:MAG: hypothetical protein RAP03_11500 [Candidatus Electryonea clarkiae]|nr:hypothetical protein [Candidatus Electryonea clarkiae]